MNCPVCKSANLVMSERQGIEIDYCPECRGVWLDRGELDKIIERSTATSPDRPPESPPRSHPGHARSHDEPHRSGHYKKKKRGGFLADLFEFD